MKCTSFLVADTETILVDNVHVPYAAGFCLVKPGLGIPNKNQIETYYSEDFREESFTDRSNIMLKHFLTRLAVKAKEEKINKVYFQHFAKFDGFGNWKSNRLPSSSVSITID